jgi:hypothetical protein
MRNKIMNVKNIARKCSACEFVEKQPAVPPNLSGVMKCRLLPRQLSMQMVVGPGGANGTAVMLDFPTVRDEDWCYQFRVRYAGNTEAGGVCTDVGKNNPPL